MELAEDYDLFMRLAEAGKVANIEDSLMRYRLHEKSLTASRTEAQYQAACRALTQAWQRRELPGDAPAARCGKTPPSREDFFWHWCYSALTEQHFPTARKYASRLVAANPRSVHHWMLWLAAACGPVAYALRKHIPFRPVRSQ